jgi:hypothetical protein
VIEIRKFDTGATRDNCETKVDYEGHMSPIVIKAYCEYMHKHRIQADGKLRDSDNWQKGMPRTEYAKSLFRHFMDFWLLHRGFNGRDEMKDALCGILFNAMGYLYELEMTDLEVERRIENIRIRSESNVKKKKRD